MSMKELIEKALSNVNKKFNVGDKVNVNYHHPKDLKYKIKKVNNISYDLEVDLSKEEIEKYKKIISESFYLHQVYIECWEERLKKNPPHSNEDILLAKSVLDNRFIYNVEENNLSSR